MDCHLTAQKRLPDTGSRTMEDMNSQSPQRRNCDDKARNCSNKLAILHGMVCMGDTEDAMLRDIQDPRDLCTPLTPSHNESQTGMRQEDTCGQFISKLSSGTGPSIPHTFFYQVPL